MLCPFDRYEFYRPFLEKFGSESQRSQVWTCQNVNGCPFKSLLQAKVIDVDGWPTSCHTFDHAPFEQAIIYGALDELKRRGGTLQNPRLAAWMIYSTVHGTAFAAEGDEPGAVITVRLMANVTVLCNTMARTNSVRGNWRTQPSYSKPTPSQQKDFARKVECIDQLLDTHKRGTGPCHAHARPKANWVSNRCVPTQRSAAERSDAVSDAKAALFRHRPFEEKLLPCSFVAALRKLGMIIDG